jgi:hypothetical protein
VTDIEKLLRVVPVGEESAETPFKSGSASIYGRLRPSDTSSTIWRRMGALSESLIGRPRAARRICTIVLRSHDDLVLLLVTMRCSAKPVRRLPSPHRRLSRAADFATGRLSLRSSGCCMKTSTRVEIGRLGGNPFDCAKGQSFCSSRGAR